MNRKEINDTGYVYFVRFDPGFIKIGYSGNPLRRITSLASPSNASHIPPGLIPETLMLIGVIRGTPDLESRMLANARRWAVPNASEWFHETPELLRLITSIPLSRAPQGGSHYPTSPDQLKLSRRAAANARWNKERARRANMQVASATIKSDRIINDFDFGA